jgi:hypothetical protein
MAFFVFCGRWWCAVAFGLAVVLPAAGCLAINDPGEFVIEPDQSANVPLTPAPTPPPSADDCRYAGVALRCEGDIPMACGTDGSWRAAGPACTLGCYEGLCAECVPGSGECSGVESARRTCSELGRWVNATPCGLEAPICRDGACLACTASQRTCIADVPQECGANGEWRALEPCPSGQSCVPETGACALCTVGERRKCRAALGACALGDEECREDGTWSPCSVAPREDTCDPGDDGNCDGKPNSPSNGGCTCSGTVACGPDTDAGECARGVSVCGDGIYGECVGAVGRQQRDCSSPLDNDCDGQRDDTLDLSCQCRVTGEPQACPDSPYPARGICRPTTRLCRASAGGTTTFWDECRGGVAPQPRDCSSHLDNDCDGTPDDESASCTCALGATEPCGEGSCFGIRTCVLTASRDASFWSECAVTAAWGFSDPQPIAGLDVAGPQWGPALFDDGFGLAFGVGEPEDIFIAWRADEGTLFAPALPVTGVNTTWIDGTPFVSADGRRLYFDSNRSGSRDLFRAQGEPGAWASPVRLDELNSEWNELNPWLPADERWIIFVSDRPGGAGGQDLWTASWNGGRFSAPSNLRGVNGPSSDEGAALTSDRLAIFFASNRPGGAGGLDVWTAARAAITDDFSAPRPLAAVNSAGNELDLALSPDGRELFFSSSRDGTQRLYRATRSCE